jgi:hypothetical protein
MRLGDPRFADFPPTPGAAQLCWYIRQTAQGVLTVHEFLADFRPLHERVEQSGSPEFASPEEARAVWDVLWAVEFCSLDVSKEENPDDWYSPDDVLAIVKRAAAKLVT